jgi:recombination protein RecT
MSTENNNGQSQTKALTKVDVLKNTLNAPSVQEQFKNALAEKGNLFIASLIDLYGGDTYLQNCDPNLVVKEALKAAVLNLPINKALGFAYIVPYKSGDKLIPQFQIGYKGLVQLAMRTGQYKTLNADVVFEGELRNVNKLTGEIDFSGQKKSDTVIGYFCHFELLNGFAKTLFMTKERVTKHAEKYSKSYTTAAGPWKKEFDAMALKTVIRNLLSHYGFLSVEMANAIVDDSSEERVQTEINQNANRKPFGFNAEEAEVLQEAGVETENHQPGPGF